MRVVPEDLANVSLSFRRLTELSTNARETLRKYDRMRKTLLENGGRNCSHPRTIFEQSKFS